MELDLLKNHWTRTAVVYHIYPRSLKDSDNNGIGDLNGITEKLDYLNDGTENSLGIGAIWLSPIYKSPMVDMGYDIADFCAIDPIFGTIADFDRFLKEAHKRNIKVIMDYVPNHSSTQHPWFIESRSSRDNPKRDWYIWADPKPDGSPPNNWLSVFGGCMWEYDQKTNQYYLHSFLKEQPDLNWRNPKVRNAMLEVLHFWLEKGVDGFRIDAINHLYKNEQLLDEPVNPTYDQKKDDPYDALQHIYTKAQPEVLKTISLFCSFLSKYKNKFTITESYVPIETTVKMYNSCKCNCCTAFNFHFITLPWKAADYNAFLQAFNDAMLQKYLPNYVLGNHDRPRVASRIGQKRARIAAMLQMTLRGIPFVYYGEELGMEDVNIPKDQITDLWEQNVPGLKLGRDPERTPMQWSADKFAGFSKVKPWLSISKKYKTINIVTQSQDPRSMLNLYKKLIHFRQKSNAILHGDFTSVNVGGDIVAFIRKYKDEKILVLLNFSSRFQNVSLELKNTEVVFDTYLKRAPQALVDLSKFVLYPNEGCIFKVE